MSVYRHKQTGRWVAQITERGVKRQVGTYATKREARAAERAALASAPSSSMTVGAWRDLWLERSDWRESTRQHNRERTGAFADAYGHVRLRDVTRSDARLWVADNPSTVGALSAMFGAAAYEDDEHGGRLLTENPFAKLGRRRMRRRDLRPDWLGQADIEGLEARALAVHGEQYGRVVAGLVRFAAETGLRPGELFALRWDDLDPRAGVVYVRRAADSKSRRVGPTKNGREREVVMTTQAHRAACRARIFGERQELVFVTVTGRQLWQPSLSTLWRPVRNAAGRPGMDFYELRHYCATRLLEAGVSDADVAVQLGHTDGGELVRRVYGHPAARHSLDRVREAIG